MSNRFVPVLCASTLLTLGLCGNLHGQAPPENDECANAFPLNVAPGGSQNENGSTSTATLDVAPFCGTSITAPGVWYSVIGNGNTMTASTCNQANYDTKISVYCGGCEVLTCVDGLDDFPGCGGFTTELSWCAQDGAEYLILIHGFSSGTGDFTLTVSDDGAACTPTVLCACDDPVLTCSANVVPPPQEGTGCFLEVLWDFFSPSDCPVQVAESFIDIGCAQIPVENGQIVQLNCDPDAPCGFEFIGDLLVITSEYAVLQVTVVDELGNDRTCHLDLCLQCPPITGIDADIDIKPGSCPNSYNPNNNGVLPVALIGSALLDPNDVDVSSITLTRVNGEGGSVSPLDGPPGPGSSIEDAATAFGGEPCDCHELTGDGIDDLLLKFDSGEVTAILELDGEPAGALIELELSGTLLDGTSFSGTDCIRLVPPGTPPGVLLVGSNLPDVWIDVAPLDEQLDSGGFTSFNRSYPQSTQVTIELPVVPALNPNWVLGQVFLDGVQVPYTVNTSGHVTIVTVIAGDTNVIALRYYRERFNYNPGGPAGFDN